MVENIKSDLEYLRKRLQELERIDKKSRNTAEVFQRLLFNLGRNMSGASTPREAAHIILQIAERLFGWDAAYVVFYSEMEDRLYCILLIDTVNEEKTEIPTVITPGEAYDLFMKNLTKEAYLVLRDEDENILTGEKMIPFGDETRLSRSIMYLPIRKGERNIGRLSIQSYSPRAYNRADLEIMQFLADLCSDALERTFTEQKLRQKDLFTAKLSELGRKLSSTVTPRDAAMTILDVADELFNWDACYINFYSRKEDRVLELVNFDVVNGERQEVSLISDTRILKRMLNRTIREGSKIILRNGKSDREDIRLTPYGNKKRRSKSLMFTPVRKGEETVGVLSIQSYESFAYNETDLESLQILADYCGGALDRIFAQEKLRQSEENLRLVSEQIPCLLWTTDEKLRFTLVRGSGFRELGLDCEKLTGASLYDFSEFDSDINKHIARHLSALKGISSSYETEMKGKFFHSYVEPLRNSGGKIIGCISVSADITQRKISEKELEIRVEERTRDLVRFNQLLKNQIEETRLAELRLENSLSLLRATLEASTDGILAFNLDGKLINYNRRLIRMWRIPQNLLKKADYAALCDFILSRIINRKEIEKRFISMCRDRNAESFDVFELKDKRILECYSRPQRIGDASIGRVWSFRDVTKRRRAEKELARSESIYREAIANAAGVPYRLIYAQNGYDFVGEGIKNLFDVSPEEFSFEILKRSLQEAHIIDSEAPSDYVECINAFKKGQLNQYRADLRVFTAKGKEKWISDSSVPIREEHTGKVIGSMGILQDITERKKIEAQAQKQKEQLIRTEKLVALGILVSGVAHEINNPNNFIMLNAPILRDAWNTITPILDEYYDDHGDFLVGGVNYSKMKTHVPVLFSGLSAGAGRIKSIVQELRDFAREDPSSVMEPVDINEVVKSSFTLLENMIKKSTKRLKVEYAEDIPIVKGSFQRLEQVIINLVQNACQALTDRNQAIYIKTRYDHREELVKVIVSDEGNGVPEDIRKYIIEPFFTTKRGSGGMGLGLSISSKIVNDHEGTLKFDSIPGKGSVVSVELPVGDKCKLTGGD